MPIDTTPARTFGEKSTSKAFDQGHRERINFNMGRYHGSVAQGMTQFSNVTHARAQAAYLRRHALDNLAPLLEIWEEKFTAKGGTVIWANSAQDARDAIGILLKERGVTSIVKSKSMITEEIKLNHFLEEIGIESVETDLGEYIQQLDGEAPYHIVTPAMHKSRGDVAALFHRLLGTPPDADAQTLTLKAREILREKYTNAGAGITGANFLLADIGGLCVLENEGNARLCAAMPPLHIVIAGIERMLPSLKDLALLLPMLSAFGTGQKLTNYNTIYTGPKSDTEKDGPREMVVILLDNGRTDLLDQEAQREALACIRCGACLNACPVYKNIGGHAYGVTYSGPIGSVISPWFDGLRDLGHLSYASSLCGNCTEVCPVNIPLHELLLKNREQYVSQGHPSYMEKTIWQMWRRAMSSRFLMDSAPAKVKNFVLGYAFRHSWGKRRKMVEVAPKSFSQMWKRGEV